MTDQHNMKIGNEAAKAATRLQEWTLQLSYGRGYRTATAEESRLLEEMWDGEENGDGNPWISLG